MCGGGEERGQDEDAERFAEGAPPSGAAGADRAGG